MYVQFLIEDRSTEKLVCHVMDKLKARYSDKYIDYDTRSFKGIGHAFCIAVKEMEAWLLGDIEAIEKAYPNAKKTAIKDYVQDEIGDTWEILANMIYPGGVNKLQKNASGSYGLIGEMKAEWADRIGKMLELDKNISPSFNAFIHELTIRVESVV